MQSPLARSQFLADQGLTVSPSDSDRSEDYDSDGTIEDIDEISFDFGAPLQRMVRGSSDDEGSYYRSGFSSCDSETASSVSTDSSVVYDMCVSIDYAFRLSDIWTATMKPSSTTSSQKIQTCIIPPIW